MDFKTQHDSQLGQAQILAECFGERWYSLSHAEQSRYLAAIGQVSERIADGIVADAESRLQSALDQVNEAECTAENAEANLEEAQTEIERLREKIQDLESDLQEERARG